MNLRFLINEYQNCPIDQKKIISFDSWDDIPQELSIDDLYTTQTQRYRDFGLIDHILMEISPKSATLLGLWIMGCFKQKKYKEYSMVLLHEKSDTKSIHLILKENNNIKTTLSEFVWIPELIDNFEQPNYFGEKPHARLTNNEEFYTKENYATRDRLEIHCGLGSACALAEFFLNFGHTVSDNTNYEYLKEIYSSDFLDVNSCEMRVHKIDAVKRNIFIEDI